ncbi:hypothetical protein [Candidatus Phycosocius spiralis]|uniref:Uncharacterized protein n=1 Tax=Candidatus Phycosocius spiralis TaxID=2815099 RepID=A0ABQ4PWG5_9PROT|nr:hypothetical protein [Candidatus Phycosocius spiralis]GIU67402.1 hypothetical protein PsB1_1556 [Candidatus Phycosocius spiralis]
MTTTDLGPITITDIGDARPPVWTFSAVLTAHIFVSALILHYTSPITIPKFADRIDIVTLEDVVPLLPHINPEVPPNTAPIMPKPDAVVVPEAAAPVNHNTSPTQPSIAKQPHIAEPTRSNVIRVPDVDSNQQPTPVPKSVTPLKSPLPGTTPILPKDLPPTDQAIAPLPAKRPNDQPSPMLREPPPASLQIQGKNSTPNATPALPKAAEVTMTNPIQREVAKSSSPSETPKPQLALPKVQVPRIPQLDRRQPESAIATPTAEGEKIAPTGAIGEGQKVNGTTGATITQGMPNQGADTALTGGGGGSLPRRLGGAGVTGIFPSSQNNDILSRMARSGECARINRPRDAKCPDWKPLEATSTRPNKSYSIAVPKDAAPGRYEIGTNPLPLCAKGTPQAQFGLSCLPSMEGPGIPKP